MKNFVFECYNNYKTFMCLNDDVLPKINPIIQKQEGKDGWIPLAYVNADEVLLPIVNLYINPRLFDCPKQFQQAKLYHEFTHILDANTMFKDYKYRDLEALLSTYSEYHASQIELACNIGFKNVHSIRKINLEKTFVSNEKSTCKIQDDYLLPLVEACCIIDKPDDQYYNLSVYDYYGYYSAFEARTLYYLGKQQLCEKISIKKIANITESNYREFAPYIIEIKKTYRKQRFLCTNKSETKSLG
jgi:hypothetical protein